MTIGTATRWLAAGALAVAVCGSADADQAGIASLLKPLDLRAYGPGTASPALAGSTLDGRRLSTTDVRGKVVLVNFWASWCAECRPEMPAFERLHRQYASQGLVVAGINAREGVTAVRVYAAELGLTFPLVLDPDGALNARYGVIGLPTTFVVGRNGRAVAFAVGARPWDGAAARALIEALLAEPRSQ